jgi:hypothetical protein
MRRSRPRLAWFEMGRMHPKGTALALLAFAALVGGCGGGSGSSTDESAARQKLQAAGQKLTDAKSFEVSLLIEGEEEGEDPEELGCLDLGVDKGKPEKLDMRIYDLNCSGGSEGRELIAIGRRAWAAGGEASWTAAKISPEVIAELNDEQTTDLKQLFEDAEDIEEVSADTAVEERAAGGEARREFHFTAPASAFPDAEDLGDTDVDFEATIDEKGYLVELVLHGEAEGAGATVTESYEDINEDLHIRPPAPSEVQGSVQQIGSKEELEALIGSVAP